MSKHDTFSTASALTPLDVQNAIELLKKNSGQTLQDMAITRTSAKPGARHLIPMDLVMIENHLLNGYFLVMPESQHDKMIPQLRAIGFYEEAIARIFKSRYLPTKHADGDPEYFLIHELPWPHINDSPTIKS